MNNILCYRPKEQFFEYGIDRKILGLRYENHCSRVKKAIKAVFYLRKEIVKGEKHQPKKNTFITPLEQRRGSAPKSCSNLKQLDENSQIPSKLHPDEKKKIAEFLGKAWKEIQIWNSFDNTNEPSEERLLSKRSDKPLSTSRLFLPKCSTSSDHGLTPTGSIRIIDTLSDQVSKRLECRAETKQKLQKQQDQKLAKQVVENQEWEKARQNLQQIQCKCNAAFLHSLSHLPQ